MFTNRYVHKQIRKRFCKYKDSQFEFLKALDDDLVKPGVEKVDYKTMKHNWTRFSLSKSGQKLFLDYEYDTDENDFEQEGSTEHSSLKFLVD